MKRLSSPQKGGPDSLIATQAINGRAEKFIWFLGWVSAIDSSGRTIFVADAHRDDGKRFVVHAEEKLTRFLNLKVSVAERRMLY
jgi:hypothetical protein